MHCYGDAMDIQFLPATRLPTLVGIALLSVAATCLAEVSPKNLLAVKITPELIRKATATITTARPPRELTVSGSDYSLQPAHPLPDMLPNTPKNLEHLPNGCTNNSASLCFDYRSGRAVYKPMRKLLPEISGMMPHNLSIRRDKIVAQYTFK